MGVPSCRSEAAPGLTSRCVETDGAPWAPSCQPLWPRWRTSSFAHITSINIITIFIIMRLRTSSSLTFSLSSLLWTRSQPSSFFLIHLIISLHHHQILFIQLILLHLPHLTHFPDQARKKTDLDIFDQEEVERLKTLTSNLENELKAKGENISVLKVKQQRWNVMLKRLIKSDRIGLISEEGSKLSSADVANQFVINSVRALPLSDRDDQSFLQKRKRYSNRFR